MGSVMSSMEMEGWDEEEKARKAAKKPVQICYAPQLPDVLRPTTLGVLPVMRMPDFLEALRKQRDEYAHVTTIPMDQMCLRFLVIVRRNSDDTLWQVCCDV